MFPSFKNKSDRESKRQALLNQYNRELQNDDVKRQAYAEAMWASDVEKNKINLLGSKTEMSTQTDTATSAASTSTGTSSGSDAGSRRSSGADPLPSVFSLDASSSGPDGPSAFSTEPRHDPDIRTDIDEMSNIDEEMKENPLPAEHYKYMIAKVYRENPSLALLRINPIPLKDDDKLDGEIHFGPNGELYNESTNKKARGDRIRRMEERIDWAASLNYIETKGRILSKARNALDEINNRNLKEAAISALYKNYVTNPREPPGMTVEDEEAYNYPRDETEDVRDTLSGVVDNVEDEYRYSMDATVTPGSDEDIKAAIDTLLVNNRDLVAKYPIVAIKKDGVAIGNQYKLAPHLLEIVTNKGNATDTTRKLTSAISWKNTFGAWIQKLTKNKKLNELVTAGTRIQIPNNKRGLADSTSSLAPDQTRHRLNPVNTGYRTRIRYIFMKYPDLVSERIPIVVFNSATGQNEFDQMYVWGPDGEIVERTTGNPPKDMAKVLKRVAWGRSYMVIRQDLQNKISEMNQRGMARESAEVIRIAKAADAIPLTGDSEYDLAEEFLLDSSKAARAIRKAVADSKINVTGRGLMGAGQGVLDVRRTSQGLKGYSGTSKNLRAIQGSGTASDLKYKQLGSKFIRVTDLRLDTPKLKLVYPNRTQVGRMIEISKPLAKVIEVLVFDQNVDQQLYNRLSVNDKQIVHDLLRLCHLETTLRDPPADPLEQLQAEFDKLRSQVMLGNDNPNNIKELKALSLDLYNNRLINDEQMRQILSL